MSSTSSLAAFKRANKHLKTNEIALIQATYEKNYKLVDSLVNEGVNVNVKYLDGYTYDQTPLMMACSVGSVECVERLLKAGATVQSATRSESRGAGDMTALHFTLQSLKQNLPEKMQILKILLKAGANPNALSNGGNTALTYVADEGRLDLVKMLVEHDADLVLARVPLSAASRDDVPMLDFCLERGLSVDASDSDGVTPLLVACRRGHESMMKRLIAEGADCSKTTMDGANALTCIAMHVSYDCRQNEDFEKALRITKFLVHKKVNINQTDKDGWTPLDYAQEANDSKVADFLKGLGAKPGAGAA